MVMIVMVVTAQMAVATGMQVGAATGIRGVMLENFSLDIFHYNYNCSLAAILPRSCYAEA